MKAIQLEQPERFRQIDLPEPSAPGPDEALVRVHRVGICGTDLSGFLGKMPFYSYPRIPGHELGIEVAAVGSSVAHVQPGDRCSVEPYLNCQTCFACRRGHSNCCENLEVLGVHTDGGMRSMFLVPARKLHPSARLSFDQLALVETLAIGCHAVQRAAPAPGDDVLVIGAGPIGLATLQFVRLSGARPLVMDTNPRRLEFCQRVLDIPTTVRADGTEEAALRAATDGRMPPVVIDATGNNQSMSRALELAAFAGKVVYVGITTSDISFPHPLMHRRELTLLASRNALPNDFTRIIDCIESGQIDTRPWITHRSTFDTLMADFPAYTRPDTGVIKAMVALS